MFCTCAQPAQRRNEESKILMIPIESKEDIMLCMMTYRTSFDVVVANRCAMEAS